MHNETKSFQVSESGAVGIVPWKVVFSFFHDQLAISNAHLSLHKDRLFQAAVKFSHYCSCSLTYMPWRVNNRTKKGEIDFPEMLPNYPAKKQSQWEL